MQSLTICYVKILDTKRNLGYLEKEKKWKRENDSRDKVEAKGLVRGYLSLFALL